MSKRLLRCKVDVLSHATGPLLKIPSTALKSPIWVCPLG
jgi:hypothetical protein